MRTKIYLLLFFIFNGVAAFAQAITIKNTAMPMARTANYNWTVFVEAAPALLDTIDHVEYLLDKSSKMPQVSMANREQKFAYSATGWAEFEIKVKIVFKSRQQPQYFNYWLKLKR